MKVSFLKAINGDSIHINVLYDGIERNILIDGGMQATYQQKGSKGKPVDGELKTLVNSIKAKGQFIDLLVITHIDEDHIGGILSWFEDDFEAHKLIKEIWFNSGELMANTLNKPKNIDMEHPLNRSQGEETSLPQGILFSELLKKAGVSPKILIEQGKLYKRFGLEFRILSPNRKCLNRLLTQWKKKDTSIQTHTSKNDYDISLKEHIRTDVFSEDSRLPNATSIAFLLSYKNKNMLFLGDSLPSVVVDGLKIFNDVFTYPIPLEFVKISHHGSSGNTNSELLQKIQSNNYVISTNGNIHHHPHKKLLARLIHDNASCNILFNYKDRMLEIFSAQDRVEYPHFNLSEITNGFEIK